MPNNSICVLAIWRTGERVRLYGRPVWGTIKHERGESSGLIGVVAGDSVHGFEAYCFKGDEHHIVEFRTFRTLKAAISNVVNYAE